jgi:eukaryotic-like serine/threonine-protein kinase
MSSIPGYRVLGELGRGGMGVVYKAEQLSLGRIVALKVMTAGVHASPAELARFRSEAESAARLGHPGIVQVHEVGQADGCPFFSLEFVAGGTLSERLRVKPLTPQEAAQLVATIARAVQFAHDQQIIHRDLKPSNVLLTLAGEPKIADFGLAKQLMGDSQTKTGEIMGTPGYMAPEQAAGVTKTIGPACDIYALGAILYQILTGRPPFYDPDPVETILQVISDEPVSVHRLAPSTPRDLVTICHKCLEKPPKKRYATAGELAADLDRFLTGQPILARRTPAWERVVKWVKRRPALAGMIGVIVVAVVTIFSYGIWKNGQLKTQRDRALKNFNLAIENTNRRIQRAGQARDDLLRDELQFLTAIRGQPGTTAEIRYERVKAARMSGDIFRKLEETKDALLAYEYALEELTLLMRGDSASQLYLRERAAVLNGRGQLRFDGDNLAAAEQDFQEAMDIFAALHQRGGTDTDSAEQRAAVEGNLVLVLNRQGKKKEALAHQERLVKVWEDVLVVYPNEPLYHRGHAVAQGNLATILLSSKPREAEKLLVQALAEVEKLPEQIKSEQFVREFSAASHTNLATVLAKRSALVEARDEYQKGIGAMEKLIVAYPEVSQYQQKKGDIQYNLALLLAGEGKFAEAIVRMDSAAKAYAALVSRHPESVALKTEQARLEKLVKELQESAQAGMP